MPTNSTGRQRYRKSLSAKAACSKAAHQKLDEIRTKLAGMNTKLACAISSGAIDPNDRMESAHRAIEVSLAIVEIRLGQLRKSGDNDWENVRIEVESAWEQLFRSIQRLITTISE
jgi:hypothetical protein